MLDYYEILEVHPKASQEVIKKAYQVLAKKYHPDVSSYGREYSEEKIKEINKAYEVLSDPVKRAEYDRMYFSAKQEKAYQADDNTEQKDTYQTEEHPKQDSTYWANDNTEPHYGNDVTDESGSKKWFIIVGVVVLVAYFLFGGNSSPKKETAISPRNESSSSSDLSHLLVERNPSPPVYSNTSRDSESIHKMLTGEINISLGDEAVNFFRSYHMAITNKNYRFAYGCLGSQLQRELGGYNKYVSGFSNTVSSVVQDAYIESAQGDTVCAGYVLLAKDKGSNNNITQQRFRGEVVLKRINGLWKIVDNRANRI